ncbi:hypothetical protein ACR2XL_27070, partial [Klebsiella pneumoniae]
LHGDVLMWLMKTLLTSGCTNQRGAGQVSVKPVAIHFERKRYFSSGRVFFFTAYKLGLME